MLIDSHCHIDSDRFDEDRDDVVQRARDAGVEVMLTIGTGDPHSDDFLKAVAVAEKYDNVFASVGVHPHDAKLYDDAAEEHLVDLAKSEKVIAWGEIGLDFYYDHSPRDVQEQVFRAHIAASKASGLPLIVHAREADTEIARILREESPRAGVLHCFSSGRGLAEVALEIGFFISISGIVTFRKADELRAIVRDVPLDRLLVETDAPYLAPVPYRGKRNEPAYVVATAAEVAELKGITLDELAAATTENFFRLFQKAHRPAISSDFA